MENTVNDRAFVSDGERSSRIVRLVGEETLTRLSQLRVLLLGLGGVGSYAFEALVRSGVGYIAAVDSDRYEPSNLNRQLYALPSTLGRPKVEVARERAGELDERCIVEPIFERITADNAESLIESTRPDIILDAIDNVTAKIAIAQHAAERGIKLVMCLGTGNRLDPSKLELCDLSATSGCPLARVMRRELRKRGIVHLDVVISREEPLPVEGSTPASMTFVPAAAGMLLASRAVEFVRRRDHGDRDRGRA